MRGIGGLGLDESQYARRIEHAGGRHAQLRSAENIVERRRKAPPGAGAVEDMPDFLLDRFQLCGIEAAVRIERLNRSAPQAPDGEQIALFVAFKLSASALKTFQLPFLRDKSQRSKFTRDQLPLPLPESSLRLFRVPLVP